LRIAYLLKPNLDKSMIFTILYKAVRMTRLVKPKTVLVMKLTAILLLAGCLHVAAATTAQKVTLSEENVSLKKVFREIKKQTGYAFFYNEKLLDKIGNVSIKASNAPLEEVLKQCFKDQPFFFSIVNKTIVVTPMEERMKELAQQAFTPPDLMFTGDVRDAVTSEPIEGASVVVKGTKRGVLTNKQGIFKIPLQPGVVLVISSIGYEKQEITMQNPIFFAVRLVAESKQLLEEVVINTGYQQLRKDNFTGTAITVSGEDLKKVNPQNVLRSLQIFDPSFRVVENNLLGSDPNRLPNITVRGSTALPGGASDVISRNNLAGTTNLPTFILDGYEVSLQKIYDLDMNRIQSISILKDAAATAVYGSRAANGVVVITTKPPKSGQLQLSYNYELNVTTPDLTEYHVLDGAQKLEYERLAGLYTSSSSQPQSQDVLDELYYNKKKAVIGGVNTYWLSQPLRTTLGHKHSAYVEGGENAIRYGLEFRYQTMPGVMKGSSRDRYSTGLNFSYTPGRKLLFRNQITVTQMKAKESPYGSFSDYVSANPYYPIRDSAGNILQQIDNWVFQGSRGPENKIALNPMYNSTLGSFSKSDYLELIDMLSIDWTIANGLRLQGQVSLNETRSTGDVFVSPFANYYFYYPTDKMDQRGRYDYSTTSETRVDGKLTLMYNRQIKKSFFNVVLGTNIQTFVYRNRSDSAVGFTNDRFTDIGLANGYGKNTKPRTSVQKERLAGLILSMNYSYDNKYLLDFSFREDGSSKFGANRRQAPFTALGLGWNMHKEAFMDHSLISRLKLRSSIGFTGSVSFSPNVAQTTYNYYTNKWYSTGVGAAVNNYGNENLEWQKTFSYDAGFELGLMQDRLVIIPRYYYRLTKGLVADVSLPPSTGFDSYKENIGDMRNTGVELSFQYAVARTKDWNINLFANLVRNTNTIVRISNALKAYNDKVDDAQIKDENKGAPLLRYNEGQSVDAIYAVRSLGVDPENGRELFMKKDGTLTYDWNVKDMAVVGNSAPKGEGSFGTNARYKQFNLSVNFFTRFGGQLYNQTLVDRVENADPRYNVDSRVFEAKWKTSGDHTFYKNIADLGRTETSSRFVQKNNMLELQSLFLSYDVNKLLYEKAGMRSLRFAFTMNDVWRWSSIQQERGIDYPYARSFTFSLQAGF
jgi:TonB-linked SusC/RagA family outer membrane protein